MATVKNTYNPQRILPPGLTLAEKLEELAWSVPFFAKQIGYPEALIHEILEGKGVIYEDLARQIEFTLKIPADFWLRKQRAYSEYLQKVEAQSEIKNTSRQVN